MSSALFNPAMTTVQYAALATQPYHTSETLLSLNADHSVTNKWLHYALLRYFFETKIAFDLPV